MIYRKLFHLLSLLLIIPVIILDDKWRIIFSIVFLLLVFLIDSLRQRHKGFRQLFMIFFRGLLKRNEFNEYTSATYLAFSYAIINLLFSKEIVIFSLLILTVCDPIAYIFGNYIKPNIRFYNKSINGFIGFFLSGIILSIFLFPEMKLASKVFAVLVSAIVELLTPIDDNLSVPIASSLVLKFTI